VFPYVRLPADTVFLRAWLDEELHISEVRGHLLINAPSEGILIRQDGRPLFINKRLIDAGGYSEEEPMARPFADYVHPDDRLH
jgi:PAS domain-containing protein